MHKNPLSTNTRQFTKKPSGLRQNQFQKNDGIPKQNNDLDTSNFTSHSSVPYVTNSMSNTSAAPDNGKKINSSGYVTNFQKQNNLTRSQIWQRQNQPLAAEDEIQVNMQQMLADSGLQVHPKQSQKLMGNAKLQKMLKSQTSQDKIAKILKKASNVQHGINEAISQFGEPQNRRISEKELDGQLRNKIESIFQGSAEIDIPSVSLSQSPTQKKLENEFQSILKANLEEQIAAKIAEEITRKITFTYDESRQQMQGDSIMSPKGRIPTKRQQPSYLKKPTFSSQQKVGSPKRRYLKKKDTRTESLNVSYNNNTSAIHDPPVFGQDDSNSVEVRQRNNGLSTASDQYLLNRSFTHKNPQNRLSQTKRANQLGASRSMKKMGTVSQRALHPTGPRQNQADSLQQQIEDKTQELTERMKQMSVYDFYQMQNANQSSSQGGDLIDAFIKKQLLESNLQNQQPKQNIQATPGVAPQVNKTFQHISNSDLPNDLISRNNSSVQSLKNLSISVDQGAPYQQRHFKNKASIILETNDEHFQSQSMTGSPQFGPMGRNQGIPNQNQVGFESFSKDTMEQSPENQANEDPNVLLSPKAEEGRVMATNTTNVFQAYNSVERREPISEQKAPPSANRFRNSQRESFRSQGSLTNQFTGRKYQHQKIVAPQQQKYYKDVNKRYNNSASRNSLGLQPSSQQQSPPRTFHERIGSSFAQKKHSTPVVANGISIRMGTEEKKPSHQKSLLVGEENERLHLKRSLHQKSVPSLPQRIESQNWKKYDYQINEYTNPFKNMFFNKSIDQTNPQNNQVNNNQIPQKDRITQLQEKYKKNLLGSEQEKVKQKEVAENAEEAPQQVKREETAAQVVQNARRDRQTRSMDSQSSAQAKSQKTKASVDRAGRVSQDLNHSSTGNLFESMIHKRLQPSSEVLLDEIQEVKINRLKSKSPACYNGAKQNDLNASVYQDLRVKQKQNSKSTRPKSGGSKNKAQAKQLQRAKYKANETEPTNEYGNHDNLSQSLANVSQQSSGNKARTFGQNHHGQLNDILKQPILIQKDRRTYQAPPKGLSKSYTQYPRRLNQHQGISKQVAQKDMVSTPSHTNTTSQRESVTVPGHRASDNEIKQLRIKAQNASQQLSIVALREIDQIRKPQRYMFFMARIYKVYYDLIKDLNNYSVLNSKKKKINRLKQQLGKDFNQDLQDEQISEVSAQDSELDEQIFVKISHKFFYAAERELKRLYTQLQDGLKKSEKEVLEKEILTEWTEKLKPFLVQNNSQYQSNTQNLCKHLKKLIENNPGSNNQFRSFAQKVLDLFALFQNFSNMCAKTRNTGGIFCKLHDFVRLCSLYTVKKCEKEMLKSHSEPTSAGITDDKGSSNLLLNTSTQKEEEEELDSQVDSNDDFEREEQKVRLSLLEDDHKIKVMPVQVSPREALDNHQKYKDEADIVNARAPSVLNLKIDVRKSSDKMRENDELQARIQAEIANITAKRESSNERFGKSIDYISPVDAVRNNIRRTVFPVQPQSGFAISLLPVDCVSDLSDFEEDDEKSSQRRPRSKRQSSRSTKDDKSHKTPKKEDEEREQIFTPADAYSPPVKQPRPVGSEQSSEEKNDHELSFEKMPSIFNLRKVEDNLEEETVGHFVDDDSEEKDENQNENHGSRVGESTNLKIDMTKSEKSAGSQNNEFEEDDNPPTPLLNSPVPIMSNSNPIGLVKIETKKDGIDIPQMIDNLDDEMKQIELAQVNKAAVESPEDQNNPYYHMMTKGFVPEYGLYNPEKGITIYEFDSDFYDPHSPDDFRICLGRCPQIVQQASTDSPGSKGKSSAAKSSPYEQATPKVIRRQGQGRGRGRGQSTRTSPGQISRNNRSMLSPTDTEKTIMEGYGDRRINEEND